MTVSIIIAVKTWQRNLEECVGKCLELDYPDFEIMVALDAELRGPSAYSDPRLRYIVSGVVSPAKKRDIAIKEGKPRGEILAFIDDDAYPHKDWLKNAAKNFADNRDAAVGGPAVTPAGDTLRQRASGRVYSSPLVSAKYVYRYLPKEKRFVEDYPSCNFLVRKSIMQELGGFDTNFWPGEDTKLCLDITKKLGRKILYDPLVLVYHHRRPLFPAHLKQVASYALHRGYFVRRYPQTSRKVSYFMPSLFLFALVGGGALSLFAASFKIPYLLGVLLYLVTVLVFSISNGLRLIAPVFFGIVSTHFTYGFYFLKGLLVKKLKEEQ